MIAQSEINELKQINVLHIAQALSLSLSGRGQRDNVGPCPNCGGDDRFHVTEKRFWCRDGDGHCGKYGDAVDLIMLVENRSYPDACKRARELANLPVAAIDSIAKSTKKLTVTLIDWRSAEWQGEASAEVEECQVKLSGSKTGLNYLYRRGFTDETILAHGLGYMREAWYANNQPFLPAITIPWHDGDMLTCVRKRFIQPPDPSDKYRLSKYCPKSRDGATGEAILFRTPIRQSKTLVIVEGEFNGMSIYQASTFNAVSSGSNSFTRKTLDALAITTSLYERVLIWFDDSTTIEKVQKAINHPAATLYQSPVIDGRKFDANALLEADMLGALLVELMPEPVPVPSVAPVASEFTPLLAIVASGLTWPEAERMHTELKATVPGQKLYGIDDDPANPGMWRINKRAY